MFYQRVQKSGDDLVIAIPASIVDTLGLHDGDMIGVLFTKGELSPDKKQAIDESLSQHEEAYKTLKDDS